MNAGTALAPRRMPIPTPSRSVAGCVLVLALWLGLLTAAPPAAANPQQDGEGLRVELTEMAPAVLRPGDDLTIRGLIHNDSDEPVTSPSVELIMQRQALSSRSEVDNWHHGTASSRIGTATPFTEDLEDDLEPHSATPFTITMPSAPTFAETSPWGPRGIEVNITGAGAGGSARSLLLWFPDETPLPAPAELSVLMPLTPTTSEWHQAATQGLPVAATAADRLAPLLTATQDQPISWALDPALLEPSALVPPSPLDLLAEPGIDDEDAGTPQPDPDDPDDTGNTDDTDDTGETGSNGGGDSGEQTGPGTDPPATDDDENATAQNGAGGSSNGDSPADDAGPGGELIAQLTQEAPRRDVLALSYADADVAALAHARDLSLWRLGQQRGSALLEQAGVDPLTDVLLPAGRIDGTTLGALAGEGAETVVTPESALAPGHSPVEHGATGHVDTTSGPLHAVVPDDRISALLTGHDPTGAELDALTSRQLLLAETAAAVREGDRSGAGFLATLPRAVTEADLGGHLADLAEVPWIDLTNLRGLLGRTPAGEPHTSTAPNLDDPGRLSPDRIEDLETTHHQVTTLAATLPEPSALLNQFEPALLSVLSAAWTSDTPARDDLMDQVDALAAQVSGAVRVEPGSSVLLINHSGDLPVTVANDLPVPARVTVALTPQDPRLRAGEPVQAVLEPETITTVRVPIQAVANGNVHLDVQVLASDGEETVGEGASFVVRVRADWEDIGTAVVAALLAVGFVIGLVRTIRSGRRRFSPSAATGTAAPGTAATDPDGEGRSR